MSAGRRWACVGGREVAVDERGSGTVLALGLVAVILMVMVALGLLAGAQSGRSRAQTAADLAALAGAGRLAVRGGADVAAACVIAGEAARRNGGVLRDCAHEGGGVLVVAVERRTSVGKAHATARAGPATAR